MSNKPKPVRVVSRKEIEEAQKAQRKPRAHKPREIEFKPFEQALRHLKVKGG